MSSGRYGNRIPSEREHRVIQLVAEGHTSKDIAQRLGVSYRTVEGHRANISRKLNLTGSLALVKFASANKSDL